MRSFKSYLNLNLTMTNSSQACIESNRLPLHRLSVCYIQEQVFATTEQPAKGAYGAARKLGGRSHNG